MHIHRRCEHARVDFSQHREEHCCIDYSSPTNLTSTCFVNKTQCQYRFYFLEIGVMSYDSFVDKIP